jgi:hypothetical protein
MAEDAAEGCERLPHVASIAIPGAIWKIRRKKRVSDPVWWRNRSPGRKESVVEDRDEKTGTDPEIEAHRRKHVVRASDEDSGEDVEAHKKPKLKATDEPETESDDVELHRKSKLVK